MLKNSLIYDDIECPRCSNTSMKQIPQEWTKDGRVAEYWTDWFFCIECGGHHYAPQENKKSTA